MSADAKAWTEDGAWDSWKGVHDGPCVCSTSLMVPHDQGANLSELLRDLEECVGRQLRWEIFEYGNGLGLRGYVA